MIEQSTSGTQASTLADLLTKPREGIQTIFELVQALDEDGDVDEEGKRLIIERRKLQPEQPEEKPRAESKRRAHTFYAAAGFVAYLKKFGSDNTVVYADSGTRNTANYSDAEIGPTVQAILDEKAENGREVVKLVPQHHPRWQPWRSLLGAHLKLDVFRELVTQNRKAIIAPDGRELIFLLRQIRMSTEVLLQSGVVKGGAAAVNGLVVRTKISGGGSDSDTLELPESITVKTPILIDEPEQTVEMDLILGGKRDGTEVYCQLASADLREAEIAAFDALVARLRTELAEDRFTVTHGTVGESDWDRLRG